MLQVTITNITFMKKVLEYEQEFKAQIELYSLVKFQIRQIQLRNTQGLLKSLLKQEVRLKKLEFKISNDNVIKILFQERVPPTEDFICHESTFWSKPGLIFRHSLPSFA